MIRNSIKPIAIIGGGISGLTAGVALAKQGIDSIVFERDEALNKNGSGTTISKNALDLLERLDVLDQLQKGSFKTDKIIIKSGKDKITELSPNILYTTRQKITEILAESYIKLGGQILYGHNFKFFNEDKKELVFENESKYLVSHVLACDGINSKLREKYFTKNEKAIFSGFNAWRGVTKEMTMDSAEMHYGPNAHLVTYPINKSLDRCFIGIIKSKNNLDESWMQKGSANEVLNDFESFDDSVFPILKNSTDLYKWGIYIRPPLKKLFVENITLLGDAAHPMVPFLGQGGCMAIEDAYTFGMLLKTLNNDFARTQLIYNKIRIKRVNSIQKLSMRIATINHLSNPVLVGSRNMIMKYSKIPQLAQRKLHDHKAHEAIYKNLN
ncbi:FAD-dependent monooxygenase [SAR86 cluster bacterium]|nr:FAD-dependent monooxygenase [SAR86 cluster bacterium]